MEKKTKTKSGRVNSGFDASPEIKKSREIIYIPVKALNILPDDEEYPFRAVLLPPTPDTKVYVVPQNQPIQIQPPAYQQPQKSNQASNDEIPTNIGAASGQSYEDTSPSPENNTVKLIEINKGLIIFLNIVSIILIAFDAMQDWCQYQEILTIDERNDTRWSLESFSDYFTFPSTGKIEAVFKNMTNIKEYQGNRKLRDYFYSILFGIPTVFGTAFLVVRLLNIIGETIKESKLGCFRGFQIIHGWTESAISLCFEDCFQCITLYYCFHESCNKEHLSYVKLIITMASGFTKNFFRYLSCRQKRYPGLNFDIGLPFGFHPWASNLYCHLCCGPQEPCSIQRQDCSVGIDCPCFCSCGRLDVCAIFYQDGKETRHCCRYNCFSCFEDKNNDPMCTKRIVHASLVTQLLFMILSILSLYYHPEMSERLYYTSSMYSYDSCL